MPADTDAVLDLLAREERSLLRAAPLTQSLPSGDSTDIFVNPLCEQVFLGAVRRDGLIRIHAKQVARTSIDLGELARLGRVEISWSERLAHAAVLGLEHGMVALVTGKRTKCDIVVAGTDPEAVGGACERLADELRDEPVPDDKVPMRFWSADSGSGYAVRRTIDVPSGTASSATTRPPSARRWPDCSRPSGRAPARCCSGTARRARARRTPCRRSRTRGARGARCTA